MTVTDVCITCSLSSWTYFSKPGSILQSSRPGPLYLAREKEPVAKKGEKCLVSTYIEDEPNSSRLRSFVSIVVLKIFFSCCILSLFFLDHTLRFRIF